MAILLLQVLAAHKDWILSKTPLQKSSEDSEAFVEKNLKGVSAEEVARFHGFWEDLPLRQITKHDIIAIFDNQLLTFDGKSYNLFV